MFPGFSHPFSCVIAGPSQSGKTVFIQKLLKAPHLYISDPPTRVVWCYGIRNEKQMENIKKGSKLPIEFVEGLPDLTELSEMEKPLLVLDDMMAIAGKDMEIADLFTKGCHHKNVSVILVLQNFFHKARFMRDIHTSCNYIIFFKNPRDNTCVMYLERQCFPYWKKYLTESYHHACSRPHGYLVIDLKQSTPNNRRLMSGIFPPETFFYYEPLESRLKKF
jgi:hypothetical protein